jgi:hypothetical protein
MAFMKLLENARRKYSKVDKLLESDEIDIPIYNVLNNNNYTQEETNFIDNVVSIAKTIFNEEKTFLKYELHIYEDILLNTISKDICIKIAKNRIRNKCNSNFIDSKLDQLNFLLNNDEFIDYFINFLANFKLKLKILSNIQEFILFKMKENNIDEEVIEVTNLINNSYLKNLDKDAKTSYIIIESYMDHILKSSEYIIFNKFFSNMYN